MCIKKVIIAGCLLISLVARADLQSFDLPGNHTARLDVPKGWVSSSGLYGMQLMLHGPMESTKEGAARPVLSVAVESRGKVELDHAALKSSDTKYREGRLRWIEKRLGKSIRFFPTQTEKWSNSLEVTIVGHEYELQGIQFVEKSYYVVCKEHLYQLKSLHRVDQTPAFADQLEKSIRSFSCG